MPKTKEGERISWKEFMERWKKGMEKITPYQRINTEIVGIKIQLTGIVCGIGVATFSYKTLWWIIIILLGVLINTYLRYIDLKKQRILFKELEENSTEMDIEEILGTSSKEGIGGNQK